MQPWINKYQPKKLNEILGQDQAIKEIKSFIESFQKQKKKALLLYGPSGSGKTSIAKAAASDYNLEFIEVNASDDRNQDSINQVLGNAINQMSLFFKGKLILIDEIDGVSGKDDRGAVPTIVKLISNPKFPVIITANNPFDQKLSTIRSKSSLVPVDALNYQDTAKILKNICEKENIKFQDLTLKTLARRTSGDVRAAINDLQTITGKKKEISQDDLKDLSERNKVEKITQALMIIFKTTQADIAVKALDNVEEDLDQVFFWIDENLPKEYTNPKDLEMAYSYLSKADLFKGRIRRWQHWRFLAYISNLLTAGIAVSKDEKYKVQINYTQTNRFLKIWQANMRYQKRKAIAAKIAKHTHTSQKEAIKNTLPFLKPIFKNDKELLEKLKEELDLDNDEALWLKT